MPVDCALEELLTPTQQRAAEPAQKERPTRRHSEGSSRKLVWSKERTAELFRRMHENGDDDARDELITMYRNLVAYLASKFRNRGEPVDDLAQVGMIGLIKAVDRFDPTRGLEFTTYATPTIVGEIKRHFRDKGWAIRVPRRLQELSGQVSQAIDVLTAKNQYSPSIAEIAKHLNVTQDDVLQALETSQVYSCVPLEGSSNQEDGESFSILDHVGEDDPLMSIADDRATLAAALKELTPQEQRVVYLRFFGGLTQSEIAKHLDISQMQVSRLLRKTLQTLRGKLVGEDIETA